MAAAAALGFGAASGVVTPGGRLVLLRLTFPSEKI
jgi:hypothetical protein